MSELMGMIVERKIKPIVFLVEKTCDFKKSKAMERLLEQMKKRYSQSKIYCEYQFMFLTFSEMTLVHSEKFIELQDFCTCKVLKQNQVDVSNLLGVLDANMTSEKLRRSWSTYYLPHVVLLSDGSSEYVNYENLNSMIENNELLKKARRCVVSFGRPSENTNEFFSQFAGTSNELMVIDEGKLSQKPTVKDIAKSIFDKTKDDTEEIERYYNCRGFFIDTFEDIVCEDPLQEE